MMLVEQMGRGQWVAGLVSQMGPMELVGQMGRIGQKGLVGRLGLVELVELGGWWSRWGRRR